jgi:hypothetical protein
MSKVKQRFLLIIHVNHAFGTYAAWILLLDDKDEGTLPRNVSSKGIKWGEKAYSPFALVVGYCGNVTSAFGNPLKGQCGIALLDSVFPSTKHPTPTTSISLLVSAIFGRSTFSAQSGSNCGGIVDLDSSRVLKSKPPYSDHP